MSSDNLKRKADDTPDLLECGVCCALIDTCSRRLQCGHYICSACLPAFQVAHETHTITCLTCLDDTEVAAAADDTASDSESTELDRQHSPDANTADNVLHHVGTATLSPFSPHSAPLISQSLAAHCELCDDMHAASHHCRDCEQSMCDALAGVHRKMRGTVHHCLDLIADASKGNSVASAAPVAVCTGDEHVGKIEFFDFHCLLMLCSNCVLAHTQAHASSIELLAAAAPHCLAEIKSLSLRFQQWHARIDQTIFQCKQRDAEVLAEKAYLVARIEQTCKQIKDAADARCSQLVFCLQGMFSAKAGALDLQIQKWNDLGAQLHAERKRIFAVATNACNASSSHASCAKIYQEYQSSLAPEMRAAPPLSVAAQSQASVLEAPAVQVQQTELCGVDRKSTLSALAAINAIQLDQGDANVDASELEDGVDNDGDTTSSKSSMDCGTMIRLKSMKDDQNKNIAIVSMQLVESQNRFVAVKKIHQGSGIVCQQLIVSNDQGKLLFVFGQDQVKPGCQVLCGAITADQNVVISMSGTNENCILIYKLNADNCTFLRRIATWGAKPGTLNKPLGLAVSTAGLIFVADSLNHRVQVFRLADGAHVRSFGTLGDGAAQFDEPVSVCLSADEQHVFVCDSQNHRIKKFNVQGKLIKTLGEFGRSDGQFDEPMCIVAAPGGRIIVADTDNHRLQFFDQDLRHIRSVRVKHGKIRSFVPLFMTLSSATGELLIKCDQVNNWIVLKLEDMEC